MHVRMYVLLCCDVCTHLVVVEWAWCREHLSVFIWQPVVLVHLWISERQLQAPRRAGAPGREPRRYTHCTCRQVQFTEKYETRQNSVLWQLIFQIIHKLEQRSLLNTLWYPAERNEGQWCRVKGSIGWRGEERGGHSRALPPRRQRLRRRRREACGGLQTAQRRQNI